MFGFFNFLVCCHLVSIFAFCINGQHQNTNKVILKNGSDVFGHSEKEEWFVTKFPYEKIEFFVPKMIIEAN